MFELFVGSVVLIALQRAFQNSAVQNGEHTDRLGADDPFLDEHLHDISAQFIPVIGMEPEYSNRHQDEVRLLDLMRSVPDDEDEDLQLAVGPRLMLPPKRLSNK